MNQVPQNREYNTPPRRTQTQRRKRKHPVALIVSALVLMIVVVGGVYFYRQYSRVKPYESVFLPNISIDDIDLSGRTPEEAVQAVMSHVAARQNSWTLSLTYQGHTFSTLNYALMGIHTDEKQVYDLLNQAFRYGHQGGTKQRIKDLEALGENPLVMYTTQSEMTDSNVDTILSQIADYFERAPQDAYLVSFDPNADDPFTIQEEVMGAVLDIAPVKEEIMLRAARGQSGSLELTPTPIPANVTTADVRKNVTLLATGKTAIAKTSEEGRTNNIKLAFSRINGTILEPGKKFSFNNIVGKRTKANGFFEAPEYAYGNLVPGIGGGVCQASTTVYLAAVCSDLKITQRTKHSAPVNYTEKGQDATVSDGRFDFQFENNSSGPVYITAHVQKVAGTKKNYECVVKMYGVSLGDGIQYKLRSVVTQTLSPDAPVYKKDTKAEHVTYTDETYKYQSARDGYVVETYLQRWENNKMVEENLITTDTYEPRSEGYYVGTKTRQ